MIPSFYSSTALILLLLVLANECSASFFAKSVDYLFGGSKGSNENSIISREQIQAAFLPFLQKLEAHNFKQKYELGRLALHLAHQLHREKMSRPNQKSSGLSYRNVDTDPAASLERAAGIYKRFLYSGFSSIENGLRSAIKNGSGYIVDKLFYLAIRNENVELVRSLLNAKNLVRKTYDMYKFALENVIDLNTETAEEIVELLCGPEVGTTAGYWFWSKLNLGFAYTNVFSYIVENDFPMLRRALDEGLNPNLVFPSHGNLLTVSVFFNCTKCVEILVERGARVDDSILFNTPVYLEAVDDTVNPAGWTPLIFAVADGQLRNIKILAEYDALDYSSAFEANKLVEVVASIQEGPLKTSIHSLIA